MAQFFQNDSPPSFEMPFLKEVPNVFYGNDLTTENDKQCFLIDIRHSTPDTFAVTHANFVLLALKGANFMS